MATAKAPQTPSTVVDGFETEGWNPEPGAKLVGTVTSLSAGFSNYRQASYPILTLHVTEDETGKLAEPKDVSVHGFQDVLNRLMLENRPAIGETVTIEYGGKRQHKTLAAQTVALYKMSVAGREGQSGWDDLFGPPPGRVQAPAATIPATGEITGQVGPNGRPIDPDTGMEVPF